MRPLTRNWSRSLEFGRSSGESGEIKSGLERKRAIEEDWEGGVSFYSYRPSTAFSIRRPRRLSEMDVWKVEVVVEWMTEMTTFGDPFPPSKPIPTPSTFTPSATPSVRLGRFISFSNVDQDLIIASSQFYDVLEPSPGIHLIRQIQTWGWWDKGIEHNSFIWALTFMHVNSLWRSLSKPNFLRIKRRKAGVY